MDTSINEMEAVITDLFEKMDEEGEGEDDDGPGYV